MAVLQIREFQSFQDYLGNRRPSLQKAFNKALSGLLDGIPLQDAPSLRKALEAGKKIRGCLSCLISDVLGGDPENSVPRAVAVELVQAATLIHDDFIDQDTLRGGRPAVWTIEGPRRAVLIGDVLFATAIKMMSDLGREEGLAISLAIARVAQGALREPLDPVLLSQEIVSERLTGQAYEKIIHLKTAILFGTACHLGAMAANADGRLGQAAYRYGLKIGEAYQIADDLKEVRLQLSRQSVNPKQMVALAPAFLRFDDEIRLYLPDILIGKSTVLTGPVLRCLFVTAKLMEKEIGTRLRDAVAEVKKGFPNNGYTALIRKTPEDIIRMFNESS